jgi:glucose-1-phosphate cytidylyltransferase
MKTVLLAGGLGTRLREETEFRPKPMVPIGGKPILWHIMKTFAHFGHEEFVVCTGYRGESIRQYFYEFEAMNSDFTVKLGSKERVKTYGALEEAGWEVTVADTGAETMTGGRIYKIRDHVGKDSFLCTYGDGLADVDISKLLKFHKSHGKIATLTAVRPISRFGVLDLSSNGEVESFQEKPQAEGWINAGYFVFEPKIFDYLEPNSILEREPMANLAKDGQLVAFRHEGFFQPMDTYREMSLLNEIWDEGKAPWKVWK